MKLADQTGLVNFVRMQRGNEILVNSIGQSPFDGRHCISAMKSSRDNNKRPIGGT